MNHDQETYELIERYLQGALEGEELLRFEQAMDEDAALAEEVNLQRSVANLLAENDIQALDEQLTAIRSEYATPAPKLLPFRKIWFAAAAVLVLGIAYIGFFMTAEPLSGEEIFMSYFEPYPADNTTRENSDSIHLDRMTLGLEAYEKGDYDEVMRMLQPLLKESVRARFYYGISQLAVGETEKAISILAEMGNDNSVYEDPAAWYCALGFLKLEKRDRAINLLERMKEVAKGKYQKLASDLLEELS